MPYCICSQPFTVDTKGHNRPEDFREIVTGEVMRLRPGDDKIVSGQVTEISDSDAAAVLVCKCGRLFWDENFTQAGMETQVYNLEQLRERVDEGTPQHKAYSEQLAILSEEIAAARKQHKPKGTLQLGASAKENAKA